MHRDMLTRTAVAAAAGCLALSLAQCSRQKEPDIQSGAAVPGAVSRVVNLDQGWSEEEQQSFWFDSQGSRLLPYDWFLALEQASSTEPFRSDSNIEQYRFLPAEPTARNPQGLPVGFAKDTDKQGQSWVGWTCAACHTGQINYKGTGIRIDGGPTAADESLFLTGLMQALQVTADDDAKFGRFAQKVLGQNQTGADDLRSALRTSADALRTRVHWDMPTTPVPAGYARLDAFGSIFNQVLAVDLELPENYKLANAPVSYPFIWDTGQSDLVEWNGAGFSAGIGSLARNTLEMLGAFGTVTVDPQNGLRGYESSAKVVSLGDLEKTLDKLWSPLWPTEYLPALDQAKVERGKALYQQSCANCHAWIDRTDPNRRITAVMTPVTDLGTDPTMVDNFLARTGKTGRLEGSKTFYLLGERIGSEASGPDILNNLVIGTIVGQKMESMEAAVDEYIKVKKPETFDPRSYKGRPLNGIWATAPFLHNGSVPSLWQLLLPPEQRVKQFYVGREFDPVNVGVDTAPTPGGFKLDTTLTGNSNAGHSYGTQLPEADRWALLEYLKSL